MTWTEIDWAILERLRRRFLEGDFAGAPYWEDEADLANYDFTYGERIGWKWDQVLRELRLRRWSPRRATGVPPPDPPGATTEPVPIVDWACGSGVASRRVIAGFGAAAFSSLTLWDHSPLACDFAAAAARRAFPQLTVAQATPGFLASREPIGLLVVSHVLNELPPEALAALRAMIDRADSVLWVEPGTAAISRQLGVIREGALSQGFHPVAPCTHAAACPIFAAGNERHWCHFFAPPPPEIFLDSHWVKFGQRAGLDLRSLPYSFLALDRQEPEPLPAGASRVLGRVEHFKPYARLLNCDAAGLTALELPKRADPALCKQLERIRAPLLARWERKNNRISGGALISLPSSHSGE
jgi:hypothetical protein